MMTIFFAALLLGFIFNIAPGAIFAETIRRGAIGGFRPALYVQLGSLAGDAIWAGLGLLGVGVLLRAEALQIPVAIAGAAYLYYLAWDSWTAAGKPVATGDDDHGSALRSGIVLSITNPQNIAYWAALGSALGAIGITDPQPLDYAVFFAGFMASSLAWCFICAAMIDRMFSGRGEIWKIWTYRLCAAAFFYLASGALWGALSQVFS